MAVVQASLTLGLLQLVHLTFAQFVFNFQVHSVTTSGLCTGFFDFDPDCETYLNRFCLRSRDHPRSLDDSDCPLGSSGRLGPTFNNLPVSREILSEQTWPGGFQMFMRAYDQDLDFDDHLDNIFIDMELPQSSNFTAIQEFTGEMNRVTVSMTFRVMMCPENFYGTNCAIFCVAQNDDQNGHYTCNGDGSIQCLPGFENTTNNCRDVNPCASALCANNGNCTAMGPFNFTCQCAPGYTGATCEVVIDPCEEVTCPDNSVCVNGSICVCMPGFEVIGELCAHPTTTGNTAGRVGAPVVIGSAVGGALILALILFSLMVMLAVFIINRRKRINHEKLPEHGSLSQSPQHKDSLRLEMTKKSAVMKKDSMMDNPVYNQVSPLSSPSPEQQESSMSNSKTVHETFTGTSASIAPNPAYGIELAHPKPHRSTIREVLNPVYGDPSNKRTDNVYSSIDHSSPHQSADVIGQQDYSYAMVEASSTVATSQQAINPVYGIETAYPTPHRSTIREVKNPVYGAPSDKLTESEGNVYSSVDQPPPQRSADETGEQEYSYAMVEAKVALSQLGEEVKGKDTKIHTTQEQSGEEADFAEHEYAVVDKSAKAQDNAAALHDQTVLPYDQLKHEQREQLQTQTRLAENEELGYSVFT